MFTRPYHSVSSVLSAAAFVFLLNGSLYDTDYTTGATCLGAAPAHAYHCGAIYRSFAADGTGWELGGSLNNQQIWLRVGIRF